MAKNLKIEVKVLSWHVVWLTAVCEAVTVGLLPLLCDVRSYGQAAKSPIMGIILGYIGMLTAILLITLFTKHLVPDRTYHAGFRVERPFVVSIWGGIYLALIFALQALFLALPYQIWTIILRAAGALAVATAIVLVLYRFMAVRWSWMSVVFMHDGRTYRVESASIISAAIFLAIYEALALPVIESISNFADIWYSGLVLGALGGGAGATGVVLLYTWASRLTPHLRLHICLQQSDPV